MSIVTKIINLLDEKNLSQKDLTDYLRVDKSTFSQWKNGKSQSYNKYLSKIAEFFNVPVSYLLDIEENIYTQIDNVYLSLAKEAQDEGINPDDIKLAIETIKAMKRQKKGAE